MLVRSVFIWEQNGAVWARLDTNASEKRLRTKLQALGIETLVEHVEQHKDLLRLNGGNYLLVRFRAGVCRCEVSTAIVRV